MCREPVYQGAMSFGEIAVVKIAYVEEEAYRMGYQRFEDAELPEDAEGLESVSHFKETAKWANTIAPRLRAMAGLQDGGHGTYQIDREVAIIKPGCEEDEPAPAELTHSRAVYQEHVAEAFDRGAYDALDGRDSNPDRGSTLLHS